MTTITLTLPDSVMSALRTGPHELPAEVRLAAVMHWYQQGRISMERAAELAGLNRSQLFSELARRGLDVFVVDLDDLRRELSDD